MQFARCNYLSHPIPSKPLLPRSLLENKRMFTLANTPVSLQALHHTLINLSVPSTLNDSSPSLQSTLPPHTNSRPTRSTWWPQWRRSAFPATLAALTSLPGGAPAGARARAHIPAQGPVRATPPATHCGL